MCTHTHTYATLSPLHTHVHTPPRMPSFAFTEACKPSLGTRTCKHLSNNIHCVHVYATQLLSTHLCKHTLVPPCPCTPLVLVNTCALPYLCTPLCTYIRMKPHPFTQRSHTHTQRPGAHTHVHASATPTLCTHIHETPSPDTHTPTCMHTPVHSKDTPVQLHWFVHSCKHTCATPSMHSTCARSLLSNPTPCTPRCTHTCATPSMHASTRTHTLVQPHHFVQSCAHSRVFCSDFPISPHVVS